MHVSSTIDVSRLSYVLLPGRPGRGFEHTALYDQAYGFWKNFWGDIYEKAGSRSALLVDDFVRQDVVGCLFYENRLVAQLTHTQFDVDRSATVDHRYFAFFPPEFLVMLKERRGRFAQSFEFLSVDPEFAHRNTQSFFADYIIGLGLRILVERGADVGIAPARSDVKVPEIASRWGYETLMSGVMRRNFPCDLIACFRESIRLHPEFAVNRVVKELWEKRLDLCGPATSSNFVRKAA